MITVISLDAIAKATYNLLKGSCEFQPKFGVFYFNGQSYDFEIESGLSNAEYTKETSFCGLQSIKVVSETIIIDPDSGGR